MAESEWCARTRVNTAKIATLDCRKAGWRPSPGTEIMHADARERGPVCGQQQAVRALLSAAACR